MRGKFIVFEGADGAGTTTQASLLAANIAVCDKNAKVRIGHTPSDGPIGSFVRNLVKTDQLQDWRSMMCLFYADMIEYTKNIIVPCLDDGYHFICDRYFPSTMVYQSYSAEKSYSSSTQVVRMRKMLDEMFGAHMSFNDVSDRYPLMKPDLTFYLNVPENVLKQRIVSRGEPLDAYEGDDRRSDLTSLYKSCIYSDNRSTFKHALDGSRSIQDIADDCFDVFEDMVKHG